MIKRVCLKHVLIPVLIISPHLIIRNLKKQHFLWWTKNNVQIDERKIMFRLKLKKKFYWGFSTKVTCAFLLQEKILELSEINTFKPQETTISPTLLIRYRFHWYRCDSGIGIFEWYLSVCAPVFNPIFICM